MSPTQTVTMSSTVGELNKTVTITSTNPYLPLEELTLLARKALNEEALTMFEGVNIEVNINVLEEALPAEPFVGTCGKPEPKKDTFNEVLVAVFCGGSAAIESERKQQEAMKFQQMLEARTGEMLENAFEWFAAKVALVPLNASGADYTINTGAHEIAKGWAHVQLLQEELQRKDKVHAEGQQVIQHLTDKLLDMQQLLAKRAEEHKAQLDAVNKASDEFRQSFDSERKALREAVEQTGKELKIAQNNLKRMKDYAMRLNSVC